MRHETANWMLTRWFDRQRDRLDHIQHLITATPGPDGAVPFPAFAFGIVYCAWEEGGATIKQVHRMLSDDVPLTLLRHLGLDGPPEYKQVWRAFDRLCNWLTDHGKAGEQEMRRRVQYYLDALIVPLTELLEEQITALTVDSTYIEGCCRKRGCLHVDDANRIVPDKLISRSGKATKPRDSAPGADEIRIHDVDDYVAVHGKIDTDDDLAVFPIDSSQISDVIAPVRKRGKRLGKKQRYYSSVSHDRDLRWIVKRIAGILTPMLAYQFTGVAVASDTGLPEICVRLAISRANENDVPIAAELIAELERFNPAGPYAQPLFVLDGLRLISDRAFYNQVERFKQRLAQLGVLHTHDFKSTDKAWHDYLGNWTWAGRIITHAVPKRLIGTIDRPGPGATDEQWEQHHRDMAIIDACSYRPNGRPGAMETRLRWPGHPAIKSAGCAQVAPGSQAWPTKLQLLKRGLSAPMCPGKHRRLGPRSRRHNRELDGCGISSLTMRFTDFARVYQWPPYCSQEWHTLHNLRNAIEHFWAELKGDGERAGFGNSWPKNVSTLPRWAALTGLAVVAADLRLIRKHETSPAGRPRRPYIEPFTDTWTSTAADAGAEIAEAAIARWEERQPPTRLKNMKEK